MKQPSNGATKPGIWGKIAAITILVVVAGTLITQRRSLQSFARNWEDFSDGSVDAKQLRHIPDLLDYLWLHRSDVSLAVFDVGDEANGIYLNADTPRPLSGVVDLQLLLGYCAQLQPDTRVPVADWERYWLPRTDGGSHTYALRALRERGAIANDGVKLRDLVSVMLRYSDDSAADVLMDQLGRARVDSLPARLGLPDEEPAWPLSGEILSWQNTQLSQPGSELARRYKALPRHGYADLAWQLMATLRQPARSAAEQTRLQDEGLTLRLRDQADLTAATSPRGRARAYAQLMARVALDELPGSECAKSALGWRLQSPKLQAHFESIGTKAGSLPGLLTSAYYARAKGHDKPRVLALFLDHLPIAVWLQLMQKFVHQRMELRLLSDDAFFEQFKQRFSQ